LVESFIYAATGETMYVAKELGDVVAASDLILGSARGRKPRP